MKTNCKTLYLISGALVIIGGKVIILSKIWFPHASILTVAEIWSAVGETVFALGVFSLVAVLVYRVFIDKTKD